MNPLYLAGGALGAIVLLEMAKPAGGASSAASSSLRGASVGYDVSWPAGAGALDAWQAMHDAAPSAMTNGQLVHLVNVWMQAWRDGCNAQSEQSAVGTASSFNFSLSTAGQVVQGIVGSGNTYECDDGVCDGDGLGDSATAVGHAVCALRAFGGTLPSWLFLGGAPANPPDVETFWQLSHDLAAAMDAADLTPGNRASDQQKTIGQTVTDALGTVIGDVLGPAFGAIASSPLLWAGVLGLVAWKALR